MSNFYGVVVFGRFWLSLRRARLAVVASVTPVTGVTLLSLIVPLKNPVKSKRCDNKYNNNRKRFNLIKGVHIVMATN